MKLVFVSIFILLLSFSMTRSVPAAQSGEPLVRAMTATGAKTEEFCINAWVKLPNAQRNDEQLAEIVQQVVEDLGGSFLDYQVTRQDNDNQHSVQAEIISPTLHALITGKNVSSGFNISEKECYLVITLEEKVEDELSIRRRQEEIQEITKKISNYPHINTCLIGWLNGTLRDGEEQDLLQKAFRVIDAKIIDKLEAERFISYTGFTSRIIEWLQVGGEKINLNMAMRYRQYDNRTYVIIGSPIITREY
ncbi:conserved exported hypothetical protein [Candidatus Desulfosporosinus infrequens]|uniref:TATA-box binding family protein n=1 Tax=Candidatus Desulfosporosinus infrequens TaxID=2043169 RepID=A0A2U3LXR7_9FIRM|nr:conserved exported hypothetical protein [Candidatus Desulfosporosinus infrequens]